METNILSDLDITALVMYCEATAIYKKAHEVWTKYNAVVASNPEAQRILDKCFYTMEKQTKIVNQLAEQLCLTPVGRARMGMAAITNKGPSELDTLLEDD
jgi:P27 family predicted phage terminase small subunit